MYYTRKVQPNGKSSWQGGRDLASSAMFTPAFCEALLKCWVSQTGIEPAQGANPLNPPEVQDELMSKDLQLNA